MRLFCLDLNAKQISHLTRLNRNTINRYLKEIRIHLAKICEDQSPFQGEIEVDESYFGARRIKGLRGRGARGKTIVFGIFKRNGKVYTEVVPDCKRKTLWIKLPQKNAPHKTGLFFFVAPPICQWTDISPSADGLRQSTD